MQFSLDAIDIKILSAVQRDSSKSTADLADEMSIATATCWRRIQRLRDEGFIKGQIMILDRVKVGLSVQIFAHVKLSAHGHANLSEFSEAIHKFPEVLECHVLMGPIDFLLRILAKDVQAYERFFFDHLSRLPGVQEINSMIALSEIKATTALPIYAK